MWLLFRSFLALALRMLVFGPRYSAFQFEKTSSASWEVENSKWLIHRSVLKATTFFSSETCTVVILVFYYYMYIQSYGNSFAPHCKKCKEQECQISPAFREHNQSECSADIVFALVPVWGPPMSSFSTLDGPFGANDAWCCIYALTTIIIIIIIIIIIVIIMMIRYAPAPRKLQKGGQTVSLAILVGGWKVF